jgi:hypothetical protein
VHIIRPADHVELTQKTLDHLRLWMHPPRLGSSDQLTVAETPLSADEDRYFAAGPGSQHLARPLGWSYEGKPGEAAR